MSSHHRRVRERLVALDVGDPQLVAMEPPIDEVAGGPLVRDLAISGPAPRPAMLLRRITSSKVQRATATPLP